MRIRGRDGTEYSCLAEAIASRLERPSRLPDVFSDELRRPLPSGWLTKLDDVRYGGILYDPESAPDTIVYFGVGLSRVDPHQALSGTCRIDDDDGCEIVTGHLLTDISAVTAVLHRIRSYRHGVRSRQIPDDPGDLDVLRLWPDETEERLFAAAVAGDLASVLVYADWLEEQGEGHVAAQWRSLVPPADQSTPYPQMLAAENPIAVGAELRYADSTLTDLDPFAALSRETILRIRSELGIQLGPWESTECMTWGLDSHVPDDFVLFPCEQEIAERLDVARFGDRASSRQGDRFASELLNYQMRPRDYEPAMRASWPTRVAIGLARRNQRR